MGIKLLLCSVLMKQFENARVTEMENKIDQRTIKRAEPVYPEPARLAPSGSYLTVTHVAILLVMSTSTVLRRFDGLPGVIDLGRGETRDKRRYRQLRIPWSALRRFIRQRAAHGGGLRDGSSSLRTEEAA
jgi:hypothetical protein